jgi:hypothetical protein
MYMQQINSGHSPNIMFHHYRARVVMPDLARNGEQWR